MSPRQLALFASSLLCLPALLGGCAGAEGQETTAAKPAPKPITCAFWNLENLFDTDDDPQNPGDDEFLPGTGWTPQRYAKKIDHLAEVIAAIDPDVLGVCEVENRKVLEDLVAHDDLKDAGYRIVHRDSPDKRGIDLALIYRAPVEIADGERAVILHPIAIDPPTRGIFEVNLTAGGNELTVLVNHWPSRWGGEERSAPLRKKAAELARRIVLARQDAVAEGGADADVIVMGDLNDDPFDDSVRRTLAAVRYRHAVLQNRNKRYLYNPCWKFFGESGVGTLYYNRDWVWNVFDQIIVSRGLLKAEGFSIDEETLAIYATDAMRDHYRRPLRFRKNRDDSWTEGYSDHFPVYVKLAY